MYQAQGKEIWLLFVHTAMNISVVCSRGIVLNMCASVTF